MHLDNCVKHASDDNGGQVMVFKGRPDRQVTLATTVKFKLFGGLTANSFVESWFQTRCMDYN